MTGGFKPAGIVASFLLAGQLLLGITPTKPPQHAPNTAQRKSAPSGKPPAKPNSAPEKPGPLNPDTEPHYAVVVENGKVRPISQSPGFNPDERDTAASHTKLLTAAAVLDAMKRNSELKTPENWNLLRKALIHSDNGAAEKLARNVAPEHTKKGAKLLLQAKAERLGSGLIGYSQ